MKVFRIACTGPCGECPPGSQKHCSITIPVPYSNVRLPKHGESLTPKDREALLTHGRTTCDRMNLCDCQVWVGSSTELDACFKFVYNHANRDEMLDVEVFTWLRSLLQDPECVPDRLRNAMRDAGNTEALDRLVEHCIELRHRPVNELHSLTEPVPA